MTTNSTLLLEPENNVITIPSPRFGEGYLDHAVAIRSFLPGTGVTIRFDVPPGHATETLRLKFYPAYNIRNLVEWERQYEFDEQYSQQNARMITGAVLGTELTVPFGTYFSVVEHSGWYVWEAVPDGHFIALVAVEGYLTQNADTIRRATQKKSFNVTVPQHLSPFRPVAINQTLNFSTKWTLEVANEPDVTFTNTFSRAIPLNKLGWYVVNYEHGPFHYKGDPNHIYYDPVTTHDIIYYVLHYYRLTSLMESCTFYKAPLIDNKGDVIERTRVTTWSWGYGGTDEAFADRGDDESGAYHYAASLTPPANGDPVRLFTLQNEKFTRFLASDLNPLSNTIIATNNFFRDEPHVYLAQWVLEPRFVNVPFFGSYVRLEVPLREIPEYHTIQWTVGGVEVARAPFVDVHVQELSDVEPYTAKFFKTQGNMSQSFSLFSIGFKLVHDQTRVDYNIDRTLINNPVIKALAQNRGFGFGTLNEAAIFAGEYPYIVQYGKSLYNIIEQYSRNPQIKFVPTLPKEVELPSGGKLKLTDKVFPPVLQYNGIGDFVVFHPRQHTWVNLVTNKELPTVQWPETNEWVEEPSARYRTEPLFSIMPPTVTPVFPAYLTAVLNYMIDSVSYRPEEIYEDIITQLFRCTPARYQPTALGKLCAIIDDLLPFLDNTTDYFSDDDRLFIRSPEKLIPTRSQYLSALAKSISFHDLQREFVITPRVRVLEYPAPTKESVKSLASSFLALDVPGRTFEDFYESEDTRSLVITAPPPPPPPLLGGPPPVVRRRITWWENQPDLDAFLRDVETKYDQISADPALANDLSDNNLQSIADDELKVVLIHLFDTIDEGVILAPDYIEFGGNDYSLLDWVRAIKTALDNFKQRERNLLLTIDDARLNPALLLTDLYQAYNLFYIAYDKLFEYIVTMLDLYQIDMLVFFQFLATKFYDEYSIYLPTDFPRQLHSLTDQLLVNNLGWMYYTRADAQRRPLVLDPAQLEALITQAPRPYDRFIYDTFAYFSENLDLIDLQEKHARIFMDIDVNAADAGHIFSEFGRYGALSETVLKVYPSVTINSGDVQRDYQNFINNHSPQFIANACMETMRTLKTIGNTDLFPTVDKVKSFDTLKPLFEQFAKFLNEDYASRVIPANLTRDDFLQWHFVEFLNFKQTTSIQNYFTTEGINRVNFTFDDFVSCYNLLPLKNYFSLSFKDSAILEAAKLTNGVATLRPITIGRWLNQQKTNTGSTDVFGVDATRVTDQILTDKLNSFIPKETSRFNELFRAAANCVSYATDYNALMNTDLSNITNLNNIVGVLVELNKNRNDYLAVAKKLATSRGDAEVLLYLQLKGVDYGAINVPLFNYARNAVATYCLRVLRSLNLIPREPITNIKRDVLAFPIPTNLRFVFNATTDDLSKLTTAYTLFEQFDYTASQTAINILSVYNAISSTLVPHWQRLYANYLPTIFASMQSYEGFVSASIRNLDHQLIKPALLTTIVASIRNYFTEQPLPKVQKNIFNRALSAAYSDDVILLAFGRPMRKFIDWIVGNVMPNFIQTLITASSKNIINPEFFWVYAFNDFTKVMYTEYITMYNDKGGQNDTVTLYGFLYQATDGPFQNGNTLFVDPYDTFVDTPVNPTMAEQNAIANRTKDLLGLDVVVVDPAIEAERLRAAAEALRLQQEAAEAQRRADEEAKRLAAEKAARKAAKRAGGSGTGAPPNTIGEKLAVLARNPKPTEVTFNGIVQSYTLPALPTTFGFTYTTNQNQTGNQIMKAFTEYVKLEYGDQTSYRLDLFLANAEYTNLKNIKAYLTDYAIFPPETEDDLERANIRNAIIHFEFVFAYMALKYTVGIPDFNDLALPLSMFYTVFPSLQGPDGFPFADFESFYTNIKTIPAVSLSAATSGEDVISLFAKRNLPWPFFLEDSMSDETLEINFQTALGAFEANDDSRVDYKDYENLIKDCLDPYRTMTSGESSIALNNAKGPIRRVFWIFLTRGWWKLMARWVFINFKELNQLDNEERAKPSSSTSP